MKKLLPVIVIAVFAIFGLLPHSVPNYDGDTDFCWSLVPTAKADLNDGFRGFVYPLLLRGTNAIFHDWMLSGRIMSASAMALSIIPIYYVAGWTGVILLLACPLFWFCGYHLTTDALLWFFFTMAYSMSRISKPVFAIFAGLAFCTKYTGIVLIVFGLLSIQFWIPFLILAGIQVALNLTHGFGILGNNFAMNVMQKGTGLHILPVLKNMVLFPLKFDIEAWPLFGVLCILAVWKLILHKEYKLIAMGLGIVLMVSTTFYSPRFLMPLMLPIIIGGSKWLKGYGLTS